MIALNLGILMQIPPHLVNHHYDDRYFDVVNAISEAKYVFFEGTSILKILQTSAEMPKKITIGETGFGAGRTFIALIQYLEENGITDASVSFNSVELHPLTPERVKLILQSFREEAGPVIELFLEAYSHIDISQHKWHQIHLNRPFGIITLNLRIGEAISMVNELDTPCDSWFLDGHGPAKNPDIWRPELMAAIGEKTKYLGTCATFTVAGVVRRALTTAGFQVEKVPGLGGKKEVLRGIKLVR